MRKEAIKDLAVIHLYWATRMMLKGEEENASLVMETSCMERETHGGQQRFTCSPGFKKHIKNHQRRNKIKNSKMEEKDLHISA